MIQIFTKDCLSVHQIKQNEKNSVYTVLIEPGSIEDAEQTGQEFDTDFEKFYPDQHAHHLIVVATNGRVFTDNYKSIFDWITAMDTSAFDWTKPFQLLDYVA
jgi:hypothetical protein